jgi:hypothetical protein
MKLPISKELIGHEKETIPAAGVTDIQRALSFTRCPLEAR